MKKNIIYTIGHSTHTQQEFLDLLKHYTIEELIDIRTIPKSRHNPQFNYPQFGELLRHHSIRYRHQKNLGGLRHAHADSINTGWHNASFRGFADYMQTPEFLEGLKTLMEIARHKTVAIMCSEAVPWRCHRSLIGDALLVHGFEVKDIFSMTSVKDHSMTPFAKVQGTHITYPGE